MTISCLHPYVAIVGLFGGLAFFFLVAFAFLLSLYEWFFYERPSALRKRRCACNGTDIVKGKKR